MWAVPVLIAVVVIGGALNAGDALWWRLKKPQRERAIREQMERTRKDVERRQEAIREEQRAEAREWARRAAIDPSYPQTYKEKWIDFEANQMWLASDERAVLVARAHEIQQSAGCSRGSPSGKAEWIKVLRILNGAPADVAPPAYSQLALEIEAQREKWLKQESVQNQVQAAYAAHLKALEL